MNKGKIVYTYDMKLLVERSEEAIINLGDNVQTFGIEALYKMLGYNQNEIKEINLYNLHNFEGEKTIVPMNAFFSGGIKSSFLPTSKDILPLFIGFHCHDEKILDNIEFFKKYEPIGCRDEYTKALISERGIDAYISGCLSIMEPKRVIEPKVKKTFFVDIPKQLEEYIPKELKENCEYINHVINVDTLEYGDEERKKYDELARQVIKKYREEATLVVTSRLHCAAPCLAMGIPVIIVKDNIDYRFGWIDKFLPIYEVNDFKNINWSPEVVDIEDTKKLLCSIFADRLNDSILGIECNSIEREKINEIDEFYSNRVKSKYNTQIIERIRKVINAKKGMSCFIWGAGRNGGLLYSTIRENFPNVTIKGFIDSFKVGNYKGLKIITPDDVGEYTNDYIFIATIPGKEMAKRKMDLVGKIEGEDYSFVSF